MISSSVWWLAPQSRVVVTVWRGLWLLLFLFELAAKVGRTWQSVSPIMLSYNDRLPLRIDSRFMALTILDCEQRWDNLEPPITALGLAHKTWRGKREVTFTCSTHSQGCTLLQRAFGTCSKHLLLTFILTIRHQITDRQRDSWICLWTTIKTPSWWGGSSSDMILIWNVRQ